MLYRSLGRTGVQVSSLCLGCMMFGRKTGEEESIAVIDRAIDGGINFMDTADGYNYGFSEDVIGKALTRNHKRSEIVLATKFRGRTGRGPNDHSVHRYHMIQACEASLKRLQTDHIDLYQVHRYEPHVAMDEVLRALDDLIRAGKVLYIGTSTMAAWQYVESLWISRELGLNRFVTEQPPYNLLDRRIERELVPMALTHGVAIMAWSPLASGFLTGKYKRGQQAPGDSRLATDPHRSASLRSERAFDIIEAVEAIAAEKGCTPSQFALAWVAQQPGICCPIIGPRNVAQVDDNLGALTVSVTDEDKQRLDAVAPPGRATIPYYVGDFGPHPHRW